MNSSRLKRIEKQMSPPTPPSTATRDPLLLVMPDNDDLKPGDQQPAPTPGAVAELHVVDEAGVCRRPGCTTTHLGPEVWG
jgi:hypothetical protein